MVCSICATIFSGERVILWEDSDDPLRGADTYREAREIEAASIRPLHRNISEICTGALDGCHICDIVWRHFFKEVTPQQLIANPISQRGNMVHGFYDSGTHYRLRKYELPGTELPEETLEIEVGLDSPKDRHIPKFKTIVVAPLEDEEHRSILSRPDPGPDYYSPATWSTIQKWLSHCKQNHIRCNRESGINWYPTRLLKIQNTYDMNSAEDRLLWLAQLATGAKYPIDVRLIETASEPPTGRYITLSHRWNDDIVLQTKKTNIDQIKRRFPAHWPSATFLDAITLALNLGVHYIWIDSLCIIQDDADDWGIEALTMGKVYTNGLINLSATTAGKGLHLPRNPSLIKPCVVYPKWKGIDSKPVNIMDSQFWGDRVHRSPCSKRGWIIQERWLSARVLHFAFDQLVWECREETMSETYPLGFPREISEYGRRDFKQEKVTLAKGEGVVSEGSLLHKDWNFILDTYGRAEMTFETDKLVAIAGIAEKVALRMNDEWMAGLWKNSLPGDLLWRVTKSRRSNKPQPTVSLLGGAGGQDWSSRLKSYQAPSWSWASVHGDISSGAYVPLSSPEAMINLLNISITPLDPLRPLGRITSALLTLYGALYPMAMDPPDWKDQHDIATRNRQRPPLPPKIYITGLAKKKVSLYGGEVQYETHSHTVTINPDQPEDYDDIALGCFLPVRMWVYDNPGHPFDGKHMIGGLCLMPTGQRQGEYKRLGVADFANDEAKLFEEGEMFRREGEKSGINPHAPSLAPGLYEDGSIGVISIV